MSHNSPSIFKNLTTKVADDSTFMGLTGSSPQGMNFFEIIVITICTVLTLEKLVIKEGNPIAYKPTSQNGSLNVLLQIQRNVNQVLIFGPPLKYLKSC